LLFCSKCLSQITEGFENVALLPASGWVLQNNSVPLGTTGWFQGNASGAFPAQSGSPNSYICANYNNVNNLGTISNWLITPNVTLKNGDVFSFFTRTTTDNMWADRLQVRMSTNGASSHVGNSATSVGDFTTLLLEINPNLQLSVYPMEWTQFTITISGLSAPTSGRLAFRYFVTNAGLSGANGDFIGIDNFVYTPYVCPIITINPTYLSQAIAGVPFSQTLTQSGGIGAVSYTLFSGALPHGLTLQSNGTISGTPNVVGSHSFSVLATDASGCQGLHSYTMMVLCNPNGASLNDLPTLCSNSAPITLNQGWPSGGAYSGIGVTGNQFDPSFGTQVISYDVYDAYGCLQTATGTIVVNPAPQVSLAPFSNHCLYGPPTLLTGGSPAGGVYSGTSVSGGIFTPNAVGDFEITYTYTDANNCSNSATQILRVVICTGLETNEKQSVRIYPNPSTGTLFLEFGDQVNMLRGLRVLNTSGQVVYNRNLNLAYCDYGTAISLDMADLSDGVYFLELVSTDNIEVLKFLIQR
jgi:hypothetical protein